MSTILSRAAVFATVCAAVASFAAAPALAQEPDNQAPDLSRLGRLVDKTVEEQLDGGEVPGAAVSIVAGGEEVYSRGYGLADVEAKTPVDARTTGFFTSSMAKLFTAAAVLQLERQDKLDLDADVNEYLGTFRIADTYPGKPMTLRHLLTHTSGFDPDYGMVDTSTNSAAQLPSLGDSLAAKQPPREEPPGTVLAYDNYGVALAGYIVERVSGVDYAKYVNEHVYDALGMTGSTASQPRPSNIDKRLATGYRPEGGEQVVTKGQFNPWSPTGPGQVTTAADMGRFMIDQLAEESELGTGIPAELMKQQYTQSEGMPGMGYIYEERPRNGMRVLFKGGDGSGFHNHMVLLPKAGMGIFFAVNGDGNDEFDSGALAEAVIDEYFPAGEVEKATPLKGHGVDGYAGDYQSSRVSHHSILKLRALTQDRVTVTANADGTVTTTGRTLSTHEDADSQKWIQVKPGLFRESNGPGTIAFDGEGVLTGSRSQNQVYLEQSWYDSPVLHQYLALAALAVLLLGLVALPTAALFARRRPQSRGPKAARLLAWLTCLLTLATTVALISLMSNQDAALEVLAVGSPLLVTVMAAASLVVAAAAGMCVAAVTAWWRGWWRLSGRVSYSLLSLSTVLFATLAITYNLTGPPFD